MRIKQYLKCLLIVTCILLQNCAHYSAEDLSLEYIRRGQNATQKRDYVSANIYFEKALEFDANSSFMAQRNIALNYFEMSQLPENIDQKNFLLKKSMTLAEKYLPDDPYDSLILSTLGNVNIQLGNIQTALGYFQQVYSVTRNPSLRPKTYSEDNLYYHPVVAENRYHHEALSILGIATCYSVIGDWQQALNYSRKFKINYMDKSNKFDIFRDAVEMKISQIEEYLENKQPTPKGPVLKTPKRG